MKYDPDHVGTGLYLKRDLELRAELHRRAILGLHVAQVLAPHRTGALQASGHVEFDGESGGYKHDRMQYSIVFDIPYAAAATYPPGPDEREYLLAAKRAIEAGA